MNREQLNDLLCDRKRTVEAALEAAIVQDPYAPAVTDAMRYSLLAGGKRIRPILVLLISECFEGDAGAALAFGTAIEMIHTYSLIHDDLPCMDNDELRRGKPTCHVKYGESTAMLAGDALLTEAFSVLSSAPCSSEQRIAAVKAASDCAGFYGMIGGQEMDLKAEQTVPSLETLFTLQKKKTGALLRLCAILGCLSAGILSDADERRVAAVTYADKIGSAFQIIDDILDRYSTAEQLGKPIGSDEENNKTTFLSYYSKEEAFAHASRLTNEACTVIRPYDKDGALTSLAEMLLSRTN